MIKVSGNVLYFTGHYAEGNSHEAYVRGGRFLSCTNGRHILIRRSGSRENEGGGGGREALSKSGAKKSAAGFVPVHRCRSPHVYLIQSQRHQMP